MTHSFSVGEIAILAHSPIQPDYAGQECLIVGASAWWVGRDPHGELSQVHGYLVRMQDGTHFGVVPELLRKRPPPREDLAPARWDECPWQPQLESA